MWVIYAFLSAICAALVSIFAKIGLKGIDSNTATMLRAFVMFIFLFLVIIFQGKWNEISNIFHENKAVNYILLSGVAGALSWLFYFVALKKANVSQVVAIDRSSLLFAVLLAYIFLGEKINWQNAVGIVLMFIGVLLVSLF